MGKKQKSKGPSDARVIAEGCGFIVGVLFAGFAFLALGSAPGDIFRWSHRDGYRQTEIILDERSPHSRSRSIGATVVETGERINIKTNLFETPVKTGRRTVLYNPAARNAAFDERVQVNVDPHSFLRATIFLWIGLILAALAWFLIRGVKMRRT